MVIPLLPEAAELFPLPEDDAGWEVCVLFLGLWKSEMNDRVRGNTLFSRLIINGVVLSDV